ncbi:MAG: M61 family peptidase, partial [Acinetobacter sp.]
VLVQQARRDGTGAKAGISAHDVIIAINGIKASEKLLEQYAKRQEHFEVLLFRRDELIRVELQAGVTDLTTVELTVVDQEKAGRWLKGEV